MKFYQILWLLLVSSIWGSSHTLVRIAVAEWGSVVTTYFRISIAAIFLLLVLKSFQKTIELKKNLKDFLVIGFLNASFPIFLFAYAARTLPASYLVILNATTPIFNAVLSSLYLEDPLTIKKIVGILLGVFGIVLLEERGTILHVDQTTAIAMACALLASSCYAMSAVYLKKSKKKIDSTILTAGSNLVGSFFILPFAIQGNWHWSWNSALAAVVVLGVLGSGFAFVVYYRLMDEVGAFRASLTTFIMPVFGLFWGWLFLDEFANIPMIIGVGLIILATSLFLKREPGLK